MAAEFLGKVTFGQVISALIAFLLGIIAFQVRDMATAVKEVQSAQISMAKELPEKYVRLERYKEDISRLEKQIVTGFSNVDDKLTLILKTAVVERIKK